MTKNNLRVYLMALFAKRRVPTRVPKDEWGSAMNTAREWWLVSSPSAKAARALCLAWPMQVVDKATSSRITSHGRNRN